MTGWTSPTFDQSHESRSLFRAVQAGEATHAGRGQLAGPVVRFGWGRALLRAIGARRARARRRRTFLYRLRPVLRTASLRARSCLRAAGFVGSSAARDVV